MGGTRGWGSHNKWGQLVVRVLPTSIRSLWSWVRALMEAKEKGNRDLP